MITALDHIHLYAADPERTLRFYEDCFGAERLGALGNDHGDHNHFLLLGGQLLVVSAFPPDIEPADPPEVGDGARRAGFGVAHFGLQTADLAGVVAKLERAGVDVHSAPRGEGAIRYVYFSAPDGVVIELVQLVLPPKLEKLRPLFDAYNRAVHVTKRAFAKQLFRA